MLVNNCQRMMGETTAADRYNVGSPGSPKQCLPTGLLRSGVEELVSLDKSYIEQVVNDPHRI